MKTLGQAAQQPLGVLEAALTPQNMAPTADDLETMISGAIFDFAGFLTTRSSTIEIGSKADAAPVVELIKEWAALRGVSLDNADVTLWRERLITHQLASLPLTDVLARTKIFTQTADM